MENYIDAITLGIVFSYLNDYELDQVAKVCRFWWKIAKEEENLRGPSSTEYFKNLKESNKSWYSIINNTIESNGARSGLQLFFTDDKQLKNCIEGCHCENLPLNSYSVVLESHLMTDKEQTHAVLLSLFFPKTRKTKIATYTFIKDPFQEGIFCPEINFHCGMDIAKVKFLKTHMKTYLVDDCCVLLFSSMLNTTFLIDFLFVLSNWFPEKGIRIWGGIIDSITVCLYPNQNIFCNVDAKIVLIFINNPQIATYIETLEDNCDTSEKIRKKLINLRQRVLLRKHAIALINTTYYRMKDFYSIERRLFKIIFPNISFFHIISGAAFLGEGLNNVIPVKHPPDFRIYLETSIMIITYD